MTLATTTSKISYAGDGSTVSFSIPFLFLVDGDITATLRDANGVETTWALNTQYTLAGAGDAAGGTLTVKTSPTDYTPVGGETLVIRRIVAETQGTDYPEGGAFPASAHEDALDRLTMLVQQKSEELARALLFPTSDAAASIDELPNSVDRLGKVLFFNATTGKPEAAAPAQKGDTGETGPQGPAGDMDGSNNLSELTDTVVARTNLGIVTGADPTDLRLAFLLIAENAGDRLNMIDGIADPFKDETDVDTGTSTNEAYDAAGNFYHPTSGGYTTDKIPVMTSNTAPSGTASASAEDTGFDAFKAFDSNQFGSTWSPNATTGWLAYEFPGGNEKTVTKYEVSRRGAKPDADQAKDWTFEGWTGSAWVTLDTQTNISWSAGADEMKSFPISNSTAYIKFRLNISANNGGANLFIADLAVMEDSPPLNMTLVSNSFTADASPATGRIHIQVNPIDAITINTDLTAEISRDGGTTWTTATLSLKETLADGTKAYEDDSVDISSQPTGTSMKWRVKTLNTKDVEVHGVVLQWAA